MQNRGKYRVVSFHIRYIKANYIESYEYSLKGKIYDLAYDGYMNIM